MSDATSKGKAAFDALELPSMAPMSMFQKFGPGMILMMTGIGTSHLVTAPVAGGRFEYALLWCLPVAFITKYHGFEMAFRFTNATGRSLLDAYATAWKKLPVWYVLVATIIQAAVGQAGRLIAAAAVLFYICNQSFGIDLPYLNDNQELGFYAFLIALSSVLIILGGDYKAVENATKVAAGILILSTFAVYFQAPAPLSSLGYFFTFDAPAGSWLIIASFLGLLPTGIDVSLQASEWGKAKKAGMGKIRGILEAEGLAPKFDSFSSRKEDLAVHTNRLPEHAREYCRRWYKIGLVDFALGHFISLVIAAMFLLLAAVWLYPSAVAGNAVMGEIARIFTDSVGPGMMVVFLIGALSATYSTAFNYFDGWPRVVGACCRNLFRCTAALPGTAPADLTDEKRGAWYSEYNVYRMTMFFSLVTSVALIVGVPQPVFMVLVASALASVLSPVIYFLNLYYCFTVIPKEDRLFYPSKATIVAASLSFLAFTAMVTVVILQEFFGVQPVG